MILKLLRVLLALCLVIASLPFAVMADLSHLAFTTMNNAGRRLAGLPGDKE